MSVWSELLLVIFLILINGFFVMSELALVSSRRSRLETLAQRGRRGARAAIALADHPSRFLSTVQVGITLVGIFTGAFSSTTLADHLAAWFATIPELAEWSHGLALAIVVASITYFSVIVGELAPKQLALGNPEPIASRVAGPMGFLSSVASPLVALLEVSSRLLLRLLGQGELSSQTVTEEEVKALIAEGARAGVLKPAERDMLAGVMRLADRRVRALMTPRPAIYWLDTDDDPATNRQRLRDARFSLLPVAKGDLDELLGVVQAKELLDRLLDGRPLDLGEAVREAPVVHDSASALMVLEVLKSSSLHLAVVVDEYGSVQGIVTTTDILTAIVGDLPEHGEAPALGIVQREDGSWLVDGDLPFDVVREKLNLEDLFQEDRTEYTTVAGFVLTHLGHIPSAGQHLDWGRVRFEVVDMDGRRIDKLLVSQRAAAGGDTQE